MFRGFFGTQFGTQTLSQSKKLELTRGLNPRDLREDMLTPLHSGFQFARILLMFEVCEQLSDCLENLSAFLLFLFLMQGQDALLFGGWLTKPLLWGLNDKI